MFRVKVERKIGMNDYNYEHYHDPTAGEVIRREESESFSFRPMVYICSPYSGDVNNNISKAQKYCRFAVNRGFIPLAPHLYFPQFLDDRTERSLALFMDIVLLSKCAELWVFGETISEGMQKEIRYAQRKGKLVKYFSEVT